MSRHYDRERDQALLEALDEETARLLFPERFERPAEVTLRFPASDGELGERIDRLTRQARGTSLEDGRREVTFGLDQLEQLHELYLLLDEAFDTAEVDVLIDSRCLPLTRELWLPLLWTLRC